MAEIIITELDFENIKQNLKTYLAAQPDFTDYDFTGSALNVLLDVLSYNTHYNAVLANLAANEMFIDSAIKRSSVVSLAKMLGYTPRSTTSAKAYVDIDVVQTTSSSPMTLGTNTVFTATINGNTYSFNVNETQSVAASSGIFSFTNVELIEGTRITNNFLVSADTLSGPFVIPNDNVDTTTIEVTVQNSSVDLTTTTFDRETSIIDVTATSEVFWVEENTNGKYQIIFGNDIIGKKLTAGNIVIVSYIVSNGGDANNARNFSLTGNISGETGVTVTTLYPAAGGAAREDIDLVRFNAPRYNAARNRAVTAEDYRSLIKANLSKAREVAVWGGENNDPPQYGKVFISIHPTTGNIITDADKNILLELLRPRSVMSIQHEFVDPEYLYIGLDGIINYNPKTTNLSNTSLAALVKADIQDYFVDEMNTLDRTFFLSKLSERVKTVDTSIVGSVFKMKLQRRISFVSGSTNHSKTLYFLTSLDPETLRSSTFTTTINQVVYNAYLQDFSDDVQNIATTGIVKLVNSENDRIIKDIGTINYQTGVVTISDLNVTNYIGNVTSVYFTANPQFLYQNITTAITRTSEISPYAINPESSKNTIIVLDDSSNNTVAGIVSGLNITALPYIE